VRVLALLIACISAYRPATCLRRVRAGSTLRLFILRQEEAFQLLCVRFELSLK
jgi:hypothetical protein